MQLAVLVALLAVAAAAPQRPFQSNFNQRPIIRIISDTREGPIGARFRYHFITENGINVEAEGTPGRAGQSNINGGFSFPFPEGGTAELTYVADENGYRPQSPLIPTPHPLPAHAIEQIRFAESQRRG